MSRPTPPAVIFFDDACVLCNGFLRRLDPYNDRFRYAPLAQGDVYGKLYGVAPAGGDRICVVWEGVPYYGGGAVRLLVRVLPVPWMWRLPLRLLPDVLVDIGYEWVARLRYLFGRQTSCAYSPSIREKMLFQ